MFVQVGNECHSSQYGLLLGMQWIRRKVGFCDFVHPNETVVCYSLLMVTNIVIARLLLILKLKIILTGLYVFFGHLLFVFAA